MIEKLIFKLLGKLTFYKQTIFISILFSFGLFSLVLDILGKESSIDLILNTIKPNVFYFVGLGLLSIIATRNIVTKSISVTTYLITHFLNVSILNISVNCIIVANLKQSTLLSEWTEGSLPYFALLTVFSLYYFYKILFISNKISKQIS